MEFLRGVFGKGESPKANPENQLKELEPRKQDCLAIFVFDSDRIVRETGDSVYGCYAQEQVFMSLYRQVHAGYERLGGWKVLGPHAQIYDGDILEGSALGRWIETRAFGIDISALGSDTVRAIMGHQPLSGVPYVVGIELIPTWAADFTHEELKRLGAKGYLGLIKVSHPPLKATIEETIGISCSAELVQLVRYKCVGRLLVGSRFLHEIGLLD